MAENIEADAVRDPEANAAVTLETSIKVEDDEV